MSQSEAVLVLLLSVATAVLTFGGVFAWFLYYRPFKRVHVSAILGTSVIATACAIITGGTLYIYHLLDLLWWMPFMPWCVLVCAGAPIAISQERKWRKLNNRTESIVDIWRNFIND